MSIVERAFRLEGIKVSAHEFEIEQGVTTYYIAFLGATNNLMKIGAAMKRLKFYGFNPDALFCDDKTRRILDAEYRTKSVIGMFIKRRGA